MHKVGIKSCHVLVHSVVTLCKNVYAMFFWFACDVIVKYFHVNVRAHGVAVVIKSVDLIKCLAWFINFH